MKGFRQYVVTKRDYKPNGHECGGGENDECDTDNAGRNKNKCRGQKRKTHPKDVSELIRAGCHVFEGLHKFEGCPHRLESAAAPAESRSKQGEFIVSVRRNLSSGIIASVGPSLALTVNVTTQRQDEFWVGNSHATKHMTHDHSRLEHYKREPAMQRVEGAGESHLSIAGDFQELARELVL